METHFTLNRYKEYCTKILLVQAINSYLFFQEFQLCFFYVFYKRFDNRLIDLKSHEIAWYNDNVDAVSECFQKYLEIYLFCNFIAFCVFLAEVVIGKTLIAEKIETKNQTYFVF